MSLRRVRDPEVIIIRSAYATEALWRAAMAEAIKHKRVGWAIDGDGRVWDLDPSTTPFSGYTVGRQHTANAAYEPPL